MAQDYANGGRSLQASPAKDAGSATKHRGSFNVSQQPSAVNSPSNMRSASDLTGLPQQQQAAAQEGGGTGIITDPADHIQKMKRSGMFLGGYQSKSGHSSLIIPGPVPPIDDKLFFSPQAKKGAGFD